MIKLRILMLNDLEYASGAEKITRALIDGLRKRGHKVEFVHKENMREYEQIRDDLGPDIIHQHNPVWLGMLAIHDMKTMAPSIQTVHDYWPMCRSRHHYLFDEDRICDNYDHVICFKKQCPNFMIHISSPNVSRVHFNHENIAMTAVSKCVADRLEKFGYNKVETILNGIVPELDHDQIEDDNYVLCVAKSHIIKGDREFAKMAKGMPYRFVLAGGGKFPEVDCVGLKKGKELNDLFRKASVVVMPSVWEEPNGLTLQEAMQYGKPIVAFDVGGIPEYVTNYIVPYRDVEAAREKIVELMENPTLRRDAGMYNKERMMREFTAEAMVDRYEKLYYRRLGFND